MQGLKQRKGRGHALGSHAGRCVGRALAVVLPDQGDEFAVLLEQAGQFSIQRRVLLADTVLQVAAKDLQALEAAEMTSRRAEQRRGQAGLAQAGDLVAALAVAVGQEFEGRRQALLGEQEAGVAGVARFGEGRIDASLVEPVQFAMSVAAHGRSGEPREGAHFVVPP